METRYDNPGTYFTSAFVTSHRDGDKEEVYPFLDDGQLASLREMTQAICSAAEGILHKVERVMKK